MLQIKCPHCPSVTSVPETLAGKTVRCGACQNIFKIEPVFDLSINNSDEAVNESEGSVPENPAGDHNADSTKDADGNSLTRLFSDPETKGIAIFAAVCISIFALAALWFYFGYIVPLATLAAAGTAFGSFVWIKKRESTGGLKFCPSCGSKWNSSENQCQKCTWDYRTQQYADPAKALLAKQPKTAPESSAPRARPSNDPFEIQELAKNCPFCGERILQVARVCKHCRSDLTGGQITTAPQPQPQGQFGKSDHVTIEKTAKGWKSLQLVGCLITLISVLGIAAGVALAKELGPIPLFVALGGTCLGFILTVYVKIMVWWHHG